MARRIQFLVPQVPRASVILGLDQRHDIASKFMCVTGRLGGIDAAESGQPGRQSLLPVLLQQLD
jgi:hypothetical protein